MLHVLTRTAREVHDVLRAASPTHRRLRDHLLAVFVATAVVDFACAALAFLLERNAQQTQIDEIGRCYRRTVLISCTRSELVL